MTTKTVCLRCGMIRHALAAAALLALGACAEVQPLDYTEAHEIPPGPGIFSGEDGAFVLYRD